jgi:hypothetical protein
LTIEYDLYTDGHSKIGISSGHQLKTRSTNAARYIFLYIIALDKISRLYRRLGELTDLFGHIKTVFGLSLHVGFEIKLDIITYLPIDVNLERNANL